MILLIRDNHGRRGLSTIYFDLVLTACFLFTPGDKAHGPRDGMEGGEGKVEVPGESLVKLVANVFREAGSSLDSNPNRLEYPTSMFPNLRHWSDA